MGKVILVIMNSFSSQQLLGILPENPYKFSIGSSLLGFEANLEIVIRKIISLWGLM